MNPIEAIVFTVDRTLGKLAKWLRILGFDARYEPGQLISRKADAEQRRRVFLTRMRQPGDVGQEVFVVRSDRVPDQLEEVATAFGLEPQHFRPFSRCIRCNEPVVEVDRERVRGRVPDYVWQSHSAFYTCERCGRIYWPGSHAGRTLQIIQELFSVGKESTS